MNTKYLLIITIMIILTSCTHKEPDKGLRIEDSVIGTEMDTRISSPVSLDYFMDDKLTSFNLLCYSVDANGEKTPVSGGTLAANLQNGTISFSSERFDNGFSAIINSDEGSFAFAKKTEGQSEEKLFSINNYDFEKSIEYGKEIPIFSQVLSTTENLEPVSLEVFYSNDMLINYPKNAKIFVVTITFSDKEFK